MAGRADTERSLERPATSWNPGGAAPSSMDIGDFYRIVAGRLRLLLPCMAIALGLALAYIALTPTTYTATMSIMIDPRERVPVGVEAPPMPQNPDAALVESQMRLLTSRPVLRKMAIDLGLLDAGESRGGLGEVVAELKSAFTGADAEKSRDARLEAIVDGLEKTIAIKRSEKTYVVDVEVKGPSRDKAVRRAQALADAFFAAQARMGDDVVAKQNVWLDAKVKDLRARVEEAERRAQNYRAAHSLVVSDNHSSPEQRLKDANTALVGAQGRLAEVEARYGQLKAAMNAGASAESVNDALRSPVIEKLRSDYAALARDEAYGLSVLGPRHPTYLTTKVQLESVRAQIVAEQQRIAVATERELKSARAAEQSAVKLVAGLESSTNKVGDDRVELNELDRAAANLRASYEKAANARENVRKDAISSPLALLIDPPVAAASPSSPKTLPALIIAFGAGLNLWIVSALVAEYRRRRAEPQPATTPPDDPAAPWRPRGAPPDGGGARRRDVARPAIIHARAPSARAGPAGRQAGPRVADMRTWNIRPGAASNILDDLLDILGDVGHPPFIGVAGEASSGGASMLALALARAACARGQRVLLIDNNEFNPALSAFTEDFEAAVLTRTRQRARILKRDPQTGGQILLVPVRGAETGDGGRKFDDRFDLALVDCGPLREAARFVDRTHALDGLVAVDRQGSDPSMIEADIRRAGLGDLCLGAALAPVSKRRAR